MSSKPQQKVSPFCIPHTIRSEKAWHDDSKDLVQKLHLRIIPKLVVEPFPGSLVRVGYGDVVSVWQRTQLLPH